MENFVHLSDRARVIVVADAKRHIHPLCQLRRYLPGHQIEVVEPASLSAVAGSADLLVLLTASTVSIPTDLTFNSEITNLAEDAFYAAALHSPTA